MMRANQIKAKLVRGEPALGVSIMFASPQLVEIVGRLGFDWVLLDCEHGTISVESLELMTMAAEATGITAIARPRTSSPDAILEVLERGVMGVQVPHVNTAEQARAIVEAVKYHPLGRRGLAARTRPAGYGIEISLDDHARRSNEETLICVQIEEKEALDNLEDILDVQGVDVFFLGPSDLSQSLGHPGRADHPDVRGAMHRAFSTIIGRGKSAGSAGSAKRWHEYREHGATYLYTHLPTILAGGARDFLDATAAAEPAV
jgi:4-hydroxy-2-oxoheptanedioate aldolase